MRPENGPPKNKLPVLKACRETVVFLLSKQQHSALKRGLQWTVIFIIGSSYICECNLCMYVEIFTIEDLEQGEMISYLSQCGRLLSN